MYLATVLERAADRYPESEVLIDGSCRLDYRGWNRRVNAAAWALLAQGLEPRRRIGLCLLNSKVAATAFFAAHKAGLEPVFLNARWKQGDLLHAMREAEVQAVLYDGFTRQEVEPAARLARVPLLIDAEPPEERDGDRASGDGVPFAELVAEPADQAPQVLRHPEDVSVILYTSGTTGRPKGAVRTHAADYHAALAMAIEHGWRRFERTLGVMPFFHTMGLHTLVSMVVLNGTLVFPEGTHAADLARAVEHERVSALFLVPTLYHDLVEFYGSTKGRAPSVPRLAYAGAPMPPELAGRCREVFGPEEIVNHYGCTEMHVITVNRQAGKDAGHVGRPALNSRIRIVRAEQERKVAPHEILPPGEVGEVIVDTSSPQAFSGYLNRPDATAAAVREGWYFTGDLGYHDEDGNLRLVGRLDDMIISGGENVYPEEVERVLCNHPGVRDAAVIGLDDERWGQAVTAVIVPAAGDLTPEELDRHCRASPDLANFKRPRRYFFAGGLPRSPTGKLLRARLREMYRSAT